MIFQILIVTYSIWINWSNPSSKKSFYKSAQNADKPVKWPITKPKFTCVIGGSYVSIWSKSISFSLSFGENKTASFTWIGSLNYPKSFSGIITDHSCHFLSKKYFWCFPTTWEAPRKRSFLSNITCRIVVWSGRIKNREKNASQIIRF